MAWVELDTITNRESAEILREISQKAHFLVDENVSTEIVDWIRESKCGHATHVREVGLDGKDDKSVHAYAWKHKLWLLTHDTDFLDDKTFPFHRNFGVIVLPGGQGNFQALREAIWDAVGIVGYFAKLFPQAKIEISEGRIWRVREFLKSEGRHSDRRIRFESNGQMSEWFD